MPIFIKNFFRYAVGDVDGTFWCILLYKSIPFALSFAAYWSLKGALLHCERPSFAVLLNPNLLL